MVFYRITKIQKNKTIEKARIEMNYLTGDAEVQRLAELREKWDMDYTSGINHARKEGEAKGIIKGKAERKYGEADSNSQLRHYFFLLLFAKKDDK